MPPRSLVVAFDTPESFQQEYDSNLSNGGVFVRTEDEFALREAVSVTLDLAFAGESLTLDAEIVHVVPAAVAGLGSAAGVAVQFAMPIAQLRERLSTVVTEALMAGTVDEESGVRSAPRKSARVTVTLEADGESWVGQTRNLSQTGALVSAEGREIAVGTKVRVHLEHPSSGHRMAVPGEVVRQVVTGGEVSALGVCFAPDVDERESLESFIEELQGVEHTRRLGGISGPLEDLGPPNLLQMFATSAPKGTLILRNEQEEGVIVFEGGLLRLARIGSATGMKALVRLLGWSEGTFEFQTHFDETDIHEPPFPLEAAMLDAVRQIDENARMDPQRFPLHAKLRVADADVVADSKVEEAVLDLAQAGFTVQRVLEVVPESDPEVFRALASLVDGGFLAIEA